MEYKGQIIEFSGTDTEYLFDIKKKKWVKSCIDITLVEKKKIYGKIVKVIRKKDWIAYKKLIGLERKEDIDDMKVMEK